MMLLVTGGEDRAYRLDPALTRLVLILAAGGLAPALDTTIVNVALATLGRELHATVATLQWVTAAYLLALAMTIPTTGWAIARLGGKRLWLLGGGIFGLASVLAALAWSPLSLIAFRALQGLGAGILQPTLQTILARAAGPRRLGRAITVITYIAVAAPILGPVAGGLILAHLSWRAIFLLNVPISLIALYAAWRGMPDERLDARTVLDWPGLLLLSPALAATIYALTRVGSTGSLHSTSVLLPLGAGLALLAAFLLRERTAQTAPLLDLHLFRKRSFAVSTALLFLSGLALYGAMLLLPLYYQMVRGASALAAGLLLAPQGVGSLLTRWAGSLTDRIGPRPLAIAGMVVAALGTVAFAFVGPATGTWLLGLSLVVRGAGLGAANIAIMAGAYQGIAPREIPHVSLTTRIVQQVGGAFGTAVLAMVLVRQPSMRAGAPVAGKALAFAVAFRWSLAFALLGAVLALALPRVGAKGPLVRGAQNV